MVKAQRCMHSSTILIFVQWLPCGKKIQLHRDPKTPTNFMLSNWTWHVKVCKLLHKNPKQQSMEFLPYINLSLTIDTIKKTLYDHLWNHFVQHFDNDNEHTFHYFSPCNRCSHLPHSTSFHVIS